MDSLAQQFPMFKNAVVRLDQATNKASVLDVIALVLGKKDAARKAWFYLQKPCKAVNDNVETSHQNLLDGDHLRGVLAKVDNVVLPGMSKPTPVAPFKTLLEIIYLLPGKRAHEVRRTSAAYMSRLLAGDLSLIDDIEARYTNSTPEEREFFRNGVEETPERAAKRTAREAQLEELVAEKTKLLKVAMELMDEQRLTIALRNGAIRQMREQINSDPHTLNERVLPDDVGKCALDVGCEVLRARLLNFANSVVSALFSDQTSGEAWLIRKFVKDTIGVSIWEEKEGRVSVVLARTAVQGAIKRRIIEGWKRNVTYCTEMTVLEAYTVLSRARDWLCLHMPKTQHTHNFSDVVDLLESKYTGVQPLAMEPALV